MVNINDGALGEGSSSSQPPGDYENYIPISSQDTTTTSCKSERSDSLPGPLNQNKQSGTKDKSEHSRLQLRQRQRPLVKILSQYEIASPSRNCNDDEGDGSGGDDSPSSMSPKERNRHQPPPPPRMPPPEPTSSAKIIVVGNAKCGKSSIIRRYAQREFSPVYDVTYGADYTKRDVVIRDVGRKVVCTRLQMWDIAGQDRFAKLTRAYFNNASGAVIVCDVTRRNTMHAVRTWKEEIDRCLGKELPVVLFANKSDCVEDCGGRASLKIGAECERITNELGLFQWYFSCAKDGDNVDDGFNHLVREILRIRRERGEGEGDGVGGGSYDERGTLRVKGHNKKNRGETDTGEGCLIL